AIICSIGAAEDPRAQKRVDTHPPACRGTAEARVRAKAMRLPSQSALDCRTEPDARALCADALYALARRVGALEGPRRDRGCGGGERLSAANSYRECAPNGSRCGLSVANDFLLLASCNQEASPLGFLKFGLHDWASGAPEDRPGSHAGTAWMRVPIPTT